MYERNQQLVSAVLRKTVGGPAQIYGRALWHGPAEYGDFVHRSGGKSAVGMEPFSGAEHGLCTAELWPDGHSHLADVIPEYLPALPGESEVSPVLESAEGPE